jgi:hypothetical protein
MEHSLPNEDRVDRKRWIARLAWLAVAAILFLSISIIVLNEWKSRQGQVDHREPLPGFSYCSSKQIRPCILSFNLNPGGGMLINILANGSAPDFHVKIRHEERDYVYECTKAERYSIHVSCTGASLPVGETVSFLIVSTDENITLAEGSFPIIGMALATPNIAMTPTHIPSFDRPPK